MGESVQIWETFNVSWLHWSYPLWKVPAPLAQPPAAAAATKQLVSAMHGQRPGRSHRFVVMVVNINGIDGMNASGRERALPWPPLGAWAHESPYGDL